VKRLLPCVILALAFHGIILSADFSWLQLAPGLAPAAKPLSITLATDMSQKRKAQAIAPQKQPEKQPEPKKNPVVMQTLKRAEQSNQFQNPLVATPPKPIAKKIRHKKSLKALTFKKQQIKTIEATQSASPPKPPVPLKAETQIYTTASAEPKPLRQPLPADTGFIKKIQHEPDGPSEPTTTAAILPDTQSDNTLSVPVLKLARPLYKQNTAPPYPRKARRLGYEGIVMLKVLIDENGRVDDLTVLKSSGHTVLDRAALSAVRKWLFEPGTEGGIKKKMWVKIPIRFDLK
jgi:protein TonB